MVTDPIANYTTSIRNALQRGKNFVHVPHSKIKEEITKILKEQGYIHNYEVQEASSPQGKIKIALKYSIEDKKRPAIHRIQRVSTPGLRKYQKASELPHVLNGLGIAIVTTSQGVMTDKEARKKKIGGEILCNIY
ncbi:MAG: 30S ribosomal protein S8 [Bacteroidota bacterium]